ncbi:hypothetical protein CPB83DRAFT_910458 [Crepidotus variabilis]|uniref:Uncharacterized protein n=1 Tax=Crepidotus variabilis TaxID=179855 RepID=A0A9P6E6W7_9AGAR|nr:hypothetical protein CPB83DRAFT_910458 [Crepidotus variabilis]
METQEIEYRHAIQVGSYVIASSFTIAICDILENGPAEVRLYQDHSMKFPSIVYFASRAATMIVFVLLAVLTLTSPSNTVAVYDHAGFDFRKLTLGLKVFVVLITIQRGFTSLVFYLRVYALYRSNYWVHGCFMVTLGGTLVSCGLYFGFSGTIVFDSLVFLAILRKLGWRAISREGSLNAGESGGHWSFWVPFKRTEAYQISDRFLQDSLLYLLLAISIKVPQVYYWAASKQVLLIRGTLVQTYPAQDFTLDIIYLDIAINCATSSKIFRDMKLGQPGLLDNPAQSTTTGGLSNLEFKVPPSQIMTSNEV